MHHLGFGTAHRGKEILAIADQASITVIELQTSEILSAHDIDPARAYWRNKQRSPGRWPRAYCHLRRDSDVPSSDGLPGEGFYGSAEKALKIDLSKSPGSKQAFWEAELDRLIAYWTAAERQRPEETQLDRIEAKLDQILKKLAA
jgi:hypothetical protein